mgnify:FL=1
MYLLEVKNACLLLPECLFGSRRLLVPLLWNACLARQHCLLRSSTWYFGAEIMVFLRRADCFSSILNVNISLSYCRRDGCGKTLRKMETKTPAAGNIAFSPQVKYKVSKC